MISAKPQIIIHVKIPRMTQFFHLWNARKKKIIVCKCIYLFSIFARRQLQPAVDGIFLESVLIQNSIIHTSRNRILREIH